MYAANLCEKKGLPLLNKRTSFAVMCQCYVIKLVYLNGNNAAEGESNIKYANSYPMN